VLTIGFPAPIRATVMDAKEVVAGDRATLENNGAGLTPGRSATVMRIAFGIT